MALTIVETPTITGGVDTHADVHVAAALDPVGGLLGVEEFPVTPAGYARLVFIERHSSSAISGPVRWVGR
jgi:transposase